MTPSATTALRAAIVAAALAVGGAATLATAADEPADQPAVAAEISMAELVQRVEAEGYTDIREIEREGKLYEVEARNAEGQEVEIMVSLDGEILSVERE